MASKPVREFVVDVTLASVLAQLRNTGEASLLQQSLPRPRFQPYTTATDGAVIDAARLYVLDTELRGALLELIHFAEISIRERFHRRLSACYGAWWFDGKKVILDDRTRRSFREAAGKVSPGAKTPDRVMASVSFGAWCDLLEAGGTSDGSDGALPGRADYEATLWEDGLKTELAGLHDTRQGAAAHLRRVRRLRNRVAHHETIIFGIHQPGEKDPSGKHRRQDPTAALNDLRTAIEHFAPKMHVWLAECDHAEQLLAEQAAMDALAFAKCKRRDISWI